VRAVRRYHPLIRRCERLCQGWDVWFEFDGEFIGMVGSRPFAEFVTFSRTGLRRACDHLL
jgi:hypothetical protein